MRILERNKQDLWYAKRTSETMIVDGNNLKTGYKKQNYDTPVKIRVSVSMSSGANNIGSQGMADLTKYGIMTGYTHNAITEDMNCPMDEECVVWYGREPTRTVRVTKVVNGEVVAEDKVVAVPYNFRVVRKAESLNHLIYYLKEVDVS